MKIFICRGCISVDIDVNANLGLVDKFCYLGQEVDERKLGERLWKKIVRHVG